MGFADMIKLYGGSMARKLAALGILILILSGCGTGFTARYDHTTLTPGANSLTTTPAATARPKPTPAVLPADLPASQIFSFGWSDLDPYQTSINADVQRELPGLLHQPHYRIDVEISDDLMYVTGREEILYTNQTGGPLDRIVLRMFPALMGAQPVVRNVTVNGSEVKPEFTGGDSVMRVPLPTPLAADASVVISLGFEYAMPADPSGNYLIFAGTSDLITLAHFYPILSVYQNGAWREDIPPKQGDILFSEAAFYLVRVHTAAGLTLVGSGSIIRRVEENSSQAVEFAAAPARDFYLAAGADLMEMTDTSTGVEIRAYGPTGSEKATRAALETARNSITEFSRLIGSYPYTEFEVVATHTNALGVEYPGVTAINEELFPSDESNDGSTPIYLISTVAHEVGHQWFYNTVGDDQILEPWLDEALTQYITYRFFGAVGGASAGNGYEQSFYERWAGVDDAEIPIGLPVEAYAPDEYGAIVYGRGPLFFIEVEEEIGRDAFDQFLQDYYAKYRWRNATRPDIESALEAACGCDLDPVFAEWVDQ